MRHPRDRVTIAVVGKYIELHDAYKSIYESLTHGGIANDVKVELRKVQAESVLERGAGTLLADVDGVLIPGGFGERGIQGKIEAVHFARTSGIPYFGICLGMQVAVIELCRNVLGLEDANTTEIDAATPHPVIALLAEQREVSDMGGTMRLGAYPAHLAEGSLVEGAYGRSEVSERHRHRYEVNNAYRQQLTDAGLVFSGVSPDGTLVEFAELPRSVHPFYVGTQAHPEFKSRPAAAHPLFHGLIGAALQRRADADAAGLAAS